MSQVVAVGLEERVFLEHIERGPFQSGVDRGRWRLVSINWPYAVIVVSAAVRANAPSEYGFRFELSGYPMSPPTAQPWDIAGGTALAHNRWPSGRGRIPLAFNPGWKNGQCLYLPCDRQAIQGHEGWITTHPEMIWSTSGDITQYLRIIYDLLNSEDYTGTRGS